MSGYGESPFENQMEKKNYIVVTNTIFVITDLTVEYFLSVF